MALELSGFTPVGYSEGIDLSLPPNGSLLITSGSPGSVASFRSAAAAGGVRIKIAAGVTLAVGARLNLGAYTQIMCLSGTAQLDLTGAGQDAALGLNTNIFLGNLEALCNAGVVSDGGNDLAAWLAFDTPECDLIYIFQCRRVIPASDGSDGPEGVNGWNNGATAASGPNRMTLHGVLNSPYAANSKFITTGATAGGTAASNTRITAYRTVSHSRDRWMFLQHGAKGDVVNSVVPNDLSRIAALNNASGEMNVRGCAIGKTSQTTPRNEVDGGSATYAPLSGAGTDNNLLINLPSNPDNGGVPRIVASKVSPYSLPYTLTPAAMDTTLMNAVVAAAGPGIYTITEGGGAPGFTSPATRRNIQRALA